MPLLKTIEGKSPVSGSNCYLAENATIVGDVTLGDDCSVWFNAVIRGDVNRITIGNRTNIQDGVVIHAAYEKFSTQVGCSVSIGHRAIVHGCTVEDNVLIGMGAIIMDNVHVEPYSIVAAGAVVTQNTHIKTGEVWAGVPAKKIKNLTSVKDREMIEATARNYMVYSSWFK